LLQDCDDLLFAVSRALHCGSPLMGLGELTFYVVHFSGAGSLGRVS